MQVHARQLCILLRLLVLSKFRVKLFHDGGRARRFHPPLHLRIQRCQPEIDLEISQRLGQNGFERPNGLGGKVVGIEELRISQSGLQRHCNFAGIVLLDGGRGLLIKVLHHESLCALLRGERFIHGIFAEFGHHLLVVLRVQRIFRLGIGQLFVKLLRFCQLAAFHVGMRQQFL